MATHCGFSLIESNTASRPAQIPPDKIKLGDPRLREPQRVWLFGLDRRSRRRACVFFPRRLLPAAARPGERAWLSFQQNDTAKFGNPGALQFVTLLRWPD